MKTDRRFVVLGGAGTIGRVVVRDLFESHPDNQILIADFQLDSAKALAESFQDKRARARFADAQQLAALSDLLSGQNVVINCLQHDFNLSVMESAFIAKVHYIDLGGLFYWTRKQLKLNDIFRDAGLTAIIGMGCAPGITNVLASYAMKQLGKARSIKIRVGCVSFSERGIVDLCFPYSAQTIIEEITLKPWIFRNGKFSQISPRTGWEFTPFPKPVGEIWTLWTRHSEIATLPLSFKKQGLRYCDFKVSFDQWFVKEVMKRLRAGWTIQQFKKLTVTEPDLDDYEVSRVMVDDLTVDCHARARPEWLASAGDIDTACPASIAAQMIANNEIDRYGVLSPEIAIPHQPFFTELEKRGMEIKITKTAS